MSRSKHQHKKNYYMTIGSKNFKNQTKGRHLDKTLERDLAKNPENADIFDYVPDTLNKKEILSLADWNYLSLQETLEKFNIIRQTHKPVEYQKFWTYLINGGIQGALYATE